MPDVELPDPERANLLALILRDLLSRAAEPPAGTVLVRSGGMAARVQAGRVESGEGPADCTVEAGLETLTRILLRGGGVRAWIEGRVRVTGARLKALRLLRVLRAKAD